MMSEGSGQGERAIVFVYNAESGLFNALSDAAHKIFSPGTYRCNLCALTHSAVGMRKNWREFLGTLGTPTEFLHADELKKLYGVSNVPLPAIFIKEGESVTPRVSASEIQGCRTIDDLKQLVKKRLLEVGRAKV